MSGNIMAAARIITLNVFWWYKTGVASWTSFESRGRGSYFDESRALMKKHFFLIWWLLISLHPSTQVSWITSLFSLESLVKVVHGQFHAHINYLNVISLLATCASQQVTCTSCVVATGINDFVRLNFPFGDDAAWRIGACEVFGQSSVSWCWHVQRTWLQAHVFLPSVSQHLT
jgi:hypothetical protein